MQPTKNYIKDGYTRRGYIMAVDRQHDALEFMYRPMLPEQVQQLDEEVVKAKPIDSVILIAAAMAMQVTEWSESDTRVAVKDGEPLPKLEISAATMRRLPYPVLSRLRNIVSGVIPCDPLPEPNKEEESEYVAALKKAREGEAPGLVQTNADLKN